MATKTDETVVFRDMFSGPRDFGPVPVKSKCICSPLTVIASRTGMGMSTMPSLSIKSSQS